MWVAKVEEVSRRHSTPEHDSREIDGLQRPGVSGLHETNQMDQTDQSNQIDLLQLLHDAFGVAGQFHVALPTSGPSLNGAGCLDSAFPIGHLCAAFGGEFLIGHAGHEFQ